MKILCYFFLKQLVMIKTKTHIFQKKTKNKTKNLKLHHLTVCLAYLSNLSFAPSSFLHNIPFYPFYLSNLLFAPSIQSYLFTYVTYHMLHLVSILHFYLVYLWNLSFTQFTFLHSLSVEPISWSFNQVYLLNLSFVPSRPKYHHCQKIEKWSKIVS